ncbi:hypothetical protein WKH56_10650 [Priestia sp. SB1]|uniref:hypothetical protein n=1 Tax=Priestia sp. SB1 TaxID=3132359 RepID=UPI00316D36E5
MKVKRNVIILSSFLILIAFIVFINYEHQEKSSETSYIKILDKGEKNGHYWVLAKDPNAFEESKFKITIDNENTWNLIQKNKEYFSTYSYVTKSKKAELENISLPGQLQKDQKAHKNN